MPSQLLYNHPVAATYAPTSSVDDLADVTFAVNAPSSSAFDGSAWEVNTWSTTSCLSSDLGTHESSLFNLLEPSTTGFPFLSTVADHRDFNVQQIGTEALDPASHWYHQPETATLSINEQTQRQNSTGSPGRGTNDPELRHKRHPGSIEFSRYNGLPCLEFPPASLDQLHVAQTEVFGHIAGIPDHSVETIQAFYNQQRGCDSSRFIRKEVLHAFVDLYLEYFDPKFPCLHHSRLRKNDIPWVLLIAVTAVGSQYSEIQDAYKYGLVLQELLSRAIEVHVSQVPSTFAALLTWTTDSITIHMGGYCSRTKSFLAPHTTVLLWY